MPVKLFVGNLSYDTESSEIRELFEQYGPVSECDVLKNYGFVHMDDDTKASMAMDQLQGFSLHGFRMRIEKSTTVKRKSSTGPSPRGGFGGRGRGGMRGGRGMPGGKFPPFDRPYDRFEPYGRPSPYERDFYSRERMPPPPGERFYGRDRMPPPPGPGGDRYNPYGDRSRHPYGREYAERGAYGERDMMQRPPPEFYERRDPAAQAHTEQPIDRYRPNGPAAFSNGYEGSNAYNSYGADYYGSMQRTPETKPQHFGANSAKNWTGGQGYSNQGYSNQQASGKPDPQSYLQTEPIFF